MAEKINNNLAGIAKRYSKALLDKKKKKNVIEFAEEDLNIFNEMYVSSKELQNTLCNPTISHNEKNTIITDLTGSFKSNIVKDFLFLLSEENRFNAFTTIYYYFCEELNKQKNIAKIEIASVIELDEGQKERLTQKLETKLGKKVQANYITKPEIIGGLVISYNGKTIDLSIKSKFENLNKQLI